MKKLILLLLLAASACAQSVTIPTDIPTLAPTQTPHVVVVTATPEVKITETLIFTSAPTAAATISCPPALFARMTLGHIPGLDIGNKKSPVIVSINCSVIAIVFPDGAQITGVLSADGRVVQNCQMSYDGKTYPCELAIPVLAMDNPKLQANGTMFKKATKELICLAETNTSYAGFCE